MSTTGALLMAAPATEGTPDRARGTDGARDRQRAFEEAMLIHRERLARLALRLCRNRTDAEDLVQETFLRAFHRFDRFTPGTNGPAWLGTILRNIFLNQVTRNGRTIVLEDAAPDRALARRERQAPATPTLEAAFFAQVIDDKRLAGALERLPGPFRQVLLLADVDGLTHREIAQRCELPIGTVMSRAFRARRLVRRTLRRWSMAAGPDRRRRGAPMSRTSQPARRRECMEVSRG